MTLVHRPTIDFIYNPDNQTKTQLIDGFVVRLTTFKRLFDDIKGTTLKHPEQHYLIEGKRGMGKTTLLLRLAYEIENDDALNEWLLPIVFNEEEYSIRRLYKLWERIAVLLADKCGEFEGLYEEMDASFSSYPSEEEYEYEMFKLLEKRLAEKGKKLILFIDNFGDIFAKFNRQEIQRLRTVLQTNTSFRIFGASSKVLEAFYDNKHPFFDFFKVKRLPGLNKEETIDLLLKLGEAYKQDQIKDIIDTQMGRTEALRRLTGGVIRTIVLLFEIFIDQKQGSAFSDLEAILDRVTPLYKHRMDSLPAQQQEIVEAIAFAWDAVSVSEISQKTRIVSKTVSAQLRQMEKNEIITKKLTNNKNHFYQINERFFNIWYLMRHGRKGDKRKVLWLVRFFEEWCDEKELVARSEEHISKLRAGNYDLKGAYYLSEVLAATKALPPESQHELLKETRDFLKKNNSEYAEYLSESDLDLVEEATTHYENANYKDAVNSLSKMRDEDKYHIGLCYDHLKNYKKAEEYYLKAVESNNTVAMNNLANLYKNELKDYKKAEKYYLEAIENGDTNTMNNLALLYHVELKDYKRAEKYYLKAIENRDINAMNNLAILYENELKDYKRAEKYYLKAIDKEHVDAMYNLALLCNNELKDYLNAEKYYLKAVDKEHVKAMYNLAFLYEDELKDYSNAEKYYLKAVDNGNTDAMYNLAFLYKNELKDYKNAEKYYLKAVDGGNVDAIFNLALLYHAELKDYKNAEKYYLKAVGKKHVGAMYGLALLYDYQLKDYKNAEKYYLKAVGNSDVDAMNNLAILYHVELKDYGKAEKYYLKAIENGNTDAMNSLAYLYYTEKMKKDDALNLAKRVYNIGNTKVTHTYAQVLLWNNQIKESTTIAKQFLYDEEFIKDDEEGFTDYLHHLQAKNQHQFLYDYFTSPEAEALHIKDQFKPIWYALMYEMQDEHPNEYLRMGEELEETVQEIIAKVEQMRVDYA